MIKRCKMKNILITLLIIIGLNFNTQAQRRKDKLENTVDSLSYALGISFAESIQKLNISDINVEKITLALDNVMNENEPKMSVQDAQNLIQKYLIELSEKQKQENLIKANEFLEENAKKEDVHVISEGLQYKILREGMGNYPQSNSKVKTNYKGTLLDGTVFDSSYERGEPIEFELGRVIKGWQEAIKHMKPGAKWILYIHPDLAYGERETGNIPPNSLLIFEIELLSVQ